MSYLSIKNVSKTYKGAKTSCINDLNLDVEEGEILVLLGPSGCGKTTILKMIAGLERQDSGTITIEGEDMDRVPTEKRPISMVFQKPYLFRNMTVSQNISFAPKVTGKFRDKEMMISETQRYIDLVKLTGMENRRPNQLSGGQEQRVSLARALIVKPKVLLLDEPLSALDAKLRVEMRSSIRNICKEIGQTVLFVTHDQEEAVAIGDRIAVVDDGKIEQVGSPEDFYTKPSSKRISDFFGWKNYIPGTCNGRAVSTEMMDFTLSDDPGITGEGLLTIRPEAFIESENGPIEARVEETKYMGVRVDYLVYAGGVKLSISMDAGTIHRPGEMIRLDIFGSGVWFIPC